MAPSPKAPDQFIPAWTRDKDGFTIPLIPCSACGRRLLYTEAAIVPLALDGLGWGHAPGLCDPEDIATYQARLNRTYGVTSVDELREDVWGGRIGNESDWQILVKVFGQQGGHIPRIDPQHGNPLVSAPKGVNGS